MEMKTSARSQTLISGDKSLVKSSSEMRCLILPDPQSSESLVTDYDIGGLVNEATKLINIT